MNRKPKRLPPCTRPGAARRGRGGTSLASSEADVAVGQRHHSGQPSSIPREANMRDLMETWSKATARLPGLRHGMHARNTAGGLYGLVGRLVRRCVPVRTASDFHERKH